MDFFTEPAAWIPNAGALIFIALLFASGYWFWATIAVVACIILIAGNR